MRLLKPGWVSHDGHPIFSLDIHPDSSRFATGGQGEDSGRVVVWNMAPVASEVDEKDESVPKMLCQMDNHLACVNCVRWSNSGKNLASGGDDKVIMIWQTVRYSGGSAVFGSGAGKVNVEQWKCVSTLRGHSGDILDMAWSPHDAWLATCSVDNSIIIWNAQRFPEILACLKGHTGLVKGVSWDPVGKYLASQSDDKTLRIWRTVDWQQETTISKPFDECGGTTHVLRLHWSPDGQYLVSAHAMNNAGPTAQIVDRDGWKTEKDFVGHRKAITCVRFNPNILSKASNIPGKIHHYCCCAIGSRDRSLSIWLTALKRPLVVIHDLFNSSVLDVSWSRRGDLIMACSWDGTVAFLKFSDDEIGKSLSDDEKNLFYQKMYGKSLVAANRANSVTTVIENPELLRLRETQEKQPKTPRAEQDASKVVTQAKGPLNRQIETRTADGRRRITPMFIAPAPDLGDAPIPFSSRLQPTFSSSTEKQSRIVIEKIDDSSCCVTPTPNDDPHHGVLNGGDPLGTHSAFNGNASPYDDRYHHLPKVVQLTPLPSENSDKVRTAPSSMTTEALRVTDKSDTSKAPKIIEVRKEPQKSVTKRGPGRPPLSEKLAQQQTHQQQYVVQDRDTPARPSNFHANSDLHLPILRPDKCQSVQIPLGRADASMILEVDNGAGTSGSLNKLKCTRSDSRSWEVLLPAKGCAVAGSRYMVCVVCEDSSLSVFSVLGSRMHCSLVLTSMASRLTCNGHYVMIITSRGCVTVWDMKNRNVLVKNETLLPVMTGTSNDLTISGTVLTDKGCPIVSLSVGKSYTYSPDMGCWLLVHNVDDISQQCCDLHACAPMQPSTSGSQPLAALQSQNKRSLQQAKRMFRHDPSIQQMSTLCHIDNQIAASLSLQSVSEFKFWILTLTRYLVQEALEGRLHELCETMLGSVPPKKTTAPDADASNKKSDYYILGMHKYDLLQEMLPIIGSNLQLQRLYAEYHERLEMSRTTVK